MFLNNISSFLLSQRNHVQMSMLVTIMKILTFISIYQLFCAIAIIPITDIYAFIAFGVFVGVYSYSTIVVDSLYEIIQQEGKLDDHTLSIAQVADSSINNPVSSMQSQASECHDLPPQHENFVGDVYQTSKINRGAPYKYNQF